MQEKEADPAALWPIEVHLSSDKRVLSLHYEGGQVRALEAEYLRVESPSAEVRGHHPSERKTVSGKRNVTMVALEPVGHYAIRIRFSDGHDTGLYSWAYLYELGRDHETRWQKYLNSLAAAGRVR